MEEGSPHMHAFETFQILIKQISLVLIFETLKLRRNSDTLSSKRTTEIMSLPLEYNKGNQKNLEELKLSVEEQGGACPNPAFHQEVGERICKAMMYTQVKLGNIVHTLWFTLFFIYGTALDIEKQIKGLKVFMESKTPPGNQISFLGDYPDGDNFTFRVPYCGQGNGKFKVELDAKECWWHFDTENLVLVADILRKSRSYLLGPEQKMWLHEPDLPAFIAFSLGCKMPFQMRTPFNFKVVITALDEEGMEIFGDHSTERLYSACFFGTGKDSPKSPHAGNSSGKKILELNHEKLLEEIQNADKVMSWFVTHDLLDKSFIEDSPLTKERKGEILRQLYEVDNIFPLFIKALETSGGNEEVVNFLLQCAVSMDRQNSSL